MANKKAAEVPPTGTERRRSQAALAVQERDMELLSDLLTHGPMLSDHIHALYFQGSTRRRMNQRCQQLEDAGLIVRRPPLVRTPASVFISPSRSYIR